MKIYLATDHSGLTLKEYLKKRLVDEGFEVEDCGAYEKNPDDDYPDFIKLAASAVSNNPTDRAIIIGGSGQGEAITANKLKSVRAVVFYGPQTPIGEIDVTGATSRDGFEIVKLTRVHNDANILSLATRFVSPEDAFHAVKLFLETEFKNEERHKRRIEKIKEIENNV